MKILIVGDVHGEIQRLAAIVRRATTELGIGAAIQVGDFGFQPDLIPEWLSSHHARFSVPVHAIDGNHEDHHWLRQVRLDREDRLWNEANLFFHDRGTMSLIGGRRFGFCGGALHPDRPQEGAEDVLLGLEPHAPNWLTPKKADLAVTAFNAVPPEVLIAHSCPASIGIGMRGGNEYAVNIQEATTELGLGAIPQDDCGEPALTRLWKGLDSKPAHWLYGHFHVVQQRTIGRTTFTCTGTGDTDEVVPIVLDTETLKLTIGEPWQMGSYLEGPNARQAVS